jgi:hypothetical protein
VVDVAICGSLKPEYLQRLENASSVLLTYFKNVQHTISLIVSYGPRSKADFLKMQGMIQVADERHCEEKSKRRVKRLQQFFICEGCTHAMLQNG